jgi:hypothetical protein
MNKEDVILMAREADLNVHDPAIDLLQRFAAIVVAAEREACAKVCEQAGVEGYGTLAAAALIRARSEK